MRRAHTICEGKDNKGVAESSLVLFQGWAKEWSVGCVNSRPVARGRQEVGFTQPRDHSFAHRCINCYAIELSLLTVSLSTNFWSCKVPDSIPEMQQQHCLHIIAGEWGMLFWPLPSPLSLLTNPKCQFGSHTPHFLLLFQCTSG